MRRILMTTVFATFGGLAALAADPAAQPSDTQSPAAVVQPGAPTTEMSKQTPDMKAPSTTDAQPATKAVDEAVPSMKPTDKNAEAPAASPPSDSSAAAPASPSSTSTAAAPSASPSSLTMNESEAKEWIGKEVYSSDGKDVGEVAEFVRDSSGKVSELHADIGGFLGIGETRVSIPSDKFSLGDEKVTLNVPEDQVEGLPKVQPATK